MIQEPRTGKGKIGKQAMEETNAGDVELYIEVPAEIMIDAVH